MKRIANRTALFWIVWAALMGFLGVFNVLHKRPEATHQWAQCDRASVARNYAEESMNFFKPRVHEAKMLTGITGMEFPLMNYAAAICYKIFGFNEFWYRLLMLLVISLGVFYGVKIAGHFIPSYYYALLITLIWYLSPIVVFYSANFLSDTAGLGFTLIGWWCFFAYQNKGGNKQLIGFAVFMALASLVKISYLIGPCVIVGLLVLDYFYFFNFKERKYQFKYKPKLFVAFAAIAGVTVAWYMYSAWLSKEYIASYFLLEIKPLTNFSKVYDTVFNSFHFWGGSFYYPGILVIMALGILFMSYHYKHVNKVLLSVTLIYFVGNTAFYFLMIQQFRVHDYYFISMFPFAFFLLLTIGDLVYRLTRRELVYFRMLLPLIVLYIFIAAADYTEARQVRRYTPGDKFYLDVFRPFKYGELEPIIKSLGITREDRVVTAFDPSPNVSLYFMNIKGYSFNGGHEREIVFQRINDFHPGYLVVNDERFLQYHYQLADILDTALLAEKNGVKLYKLNYHE